MRAFFCLLHSASGFALPVCDQTGSFTVCYRNHWAVGPSPRRMPVSPPLTLNAHVAASVHRCRSHAAPPWRYLSQVALGCSVLFACQLIIHCCPTPGCKPARSTKTLRTGKRPIKELFCDRIHPAWAAAVAPVNGVAINVATAHAPTAAAPNAMLLRLAPSSGTTYCHARDVVSEGAHARAAAAASATGQTT